MINRVCITQDEHIGATIYGLRNLRNLSVRQLADKTGLGKSTISKIENGNRLPSLKALSSILEALDAELFVMDRRPADD